jgi:hypothetical protein
LGDDNEMETIEKLFETKRNQHMVKIGAWRQYLARKRKKNFDVDI